MSFKALVYAYVLGGLTFIPFVLVALVFFTIYTSVPVGDTDPSKNARLDLTDTSLEAEEKDGEGGHARTDAAPRLPDVNDVPRTRKGWLTMRRTFEESSFDGSYVTLVRSFLDARSKDPKRSRPKDMWYVVLKGKVLYLYEDEAMTECEVAIELSGYEVTIYPEGQLDGELFAKRNAICLRSKVSSEDKGTPSVTKQTAVDSMDTGTKTDEANEGGGTVEAEKKRAKARDEVIAPWFIFVRSNVEMEDWYFALIHASEQPAHSPTLTPLQSIFQPADMNHLVQTLDEQPDVIPMRWLNALIGRIFFSYYRTHTLEAYIIGRLMKKLSKVKRPAFLTDVVVKEVSIGNRPPTLSKPMLKELTKEGDAALEVHLQYKGEIRITVEAMATINLGSRFKPYNVKLVLAAVLKEIEGNLLVKVKRPPSNRIWYAFTQTPRMVLAVEPIVSDRQITWTMILSTIEARLKEIIQESVVMPNMDDIAFFESTPYQHRGGIWADASRHETPPASLLNQNPVSVEMLSTTSAPATVEGTSIPSVEIDASSSKEDASSATLLPPEAASVQSMPATLPTSKDAMDVSSSVKDSNTSSRRRTWFSSLRSDDLNSLVAQQANASPDTITDEERGRPSEKNKDAVALNQAHRSRSTLSTYSDAPDSDDQEPSVPLHKHLSATSTPQRQSHHQKGFSISSDGSGVSSYTDGSAISAASSRNADSTLPRNGNIPSTPASPTSFLSQLKSRATDKQALSNSAKEAMRKWGMNWGGLRKDSNRERESTASEDTSGNEDLPDHGTIGSRLLDGNASLAQRARASYAEVRAAVAERREKEREREKGKGTEMGKDESSTDNGFLRVDDHLTPASSSPISIPEGGKTRARVVSAPGLGIPSVSRSSSTGDKDAISRTGSQASEGSDGSIPAPSTSAPSAPSINIDVDEEGEVKPTSPIHKQPQAKMMTIPGIHASHRGDIMSMGYVAPEPQASTPIAIKDQELAGSKIKLPQNPTIQNMYRFWKSPATSGMASPSSSRLGPISSVQSTGQSGNPTDSNFGPPRGSTSSPSVAPPPLTSRIPPPLPPRSTPTAVTRVPTEPTQPSSSSGSSDIAKGAEPSVHESPKSAPSASETLKNIATKDENIRTMRASQEQNSTNTNTSPQPSPPRPASRRVSANSDVSTLDGSIDLEGPKTEDAPKGVEAGTNIDESHELQHDHNDDAHDAVEDSLPTPTPPPQQLRYPNPGPPLPPRRTQTTT